MTATPRDDRRHERRTAPALAGWRRGWSFTPLDGKRPILPGWPSRPRETMEELTAWTRAGNVGLRTGKASGIVVVDVDLLDGETSYDAWKRAQQVGCVPTVTAVTGAGGLHLYYASPKNAVVANSAGKLAPHIDVRGEGGQVVFVGGTHPKTGAPYHWADHLSPDDIDVADLPASVLEALQATPAKAQPPRNRAAFAQDETDAMTPLERCKRYLATKPDAVSGEGGHAVTLNAACECFRFGLTEADAAEAMAWFNATKCRPPWTPKELEHKLADGRAKVLESGAFGVRLREARPDAGPLPSAVAATPCHEASSPVAALQGAPWLPCDTERWAAAPAPPVDWVFEDLLAQGELGLIAAAGGLGKTWLALLLGLSTATGRALLPAFRPTRPLKTLLLLGEDSELMLWRRFRAIPGVDAEPTLRRENFHVIAHHAEPLVAYSGGNPVRTPRWRWLKERIAGAGFQVILLDPLARWHSVDENSATAMTAVVQALETLTETGTVLVTHHVRKGDGKSDGGGLGSDAARGSSALRDGVRWQANLAEVTESEARAIGAQSVRGYVKLDLSKANNVARLPAPILFKRGPGGCLEQVDVVERSIETLARAIGDWVAQHPDKAIDPRDVRRRAGGAPPLAALVGDLRLRFGRRAARWENIQKALDHAVQAGTIVLKKGHRGQVLCPPPHSAPKCSNFQ